MNPIEEHKLILSELCNIMRLSFSGPYDVLNCHFDYRESDDGSSSVGAEFWYEHEGNTVSLPLVYPERKQLTMLVPKLHSMMYSHTGGDWEGFLLSIDRHGKAKTTFEYRK
ncbi:hypothetical protein V4T56_004215 [Vibrio vulnificus]|uniref:hypothetical protein n=1 Tax=Vibrio kanaloae TaxID=170673 RepID=UPI001247B80E|nr:hypothetical protein [Vibrio kanaloae]EIZ1354549.1 hypothetical protein [Vibrio vulnificus]KAB0457901.1 hypothetical protein F7Q89_20520 [Vibrio kanaloae]